MATVQQNQLDEEKKDQQQGPIDTGTVSTGATGSVAPSAQGNFRTADQRRGSGRFTNVQQYLQKNMPGGQRLAEKVGGSLTGKTGEQQQKAQDYYSKIREGIGQAQNVAKQGAQFQQQLGQIGQNIGGATIGQDVDQQKALEMYRNRPTDLGIQQFVESPSFDEFQRIQSGLGINEAALRQQQAQLGQAAQGALTGAQTGLEKIGTEKGRFQLLREQLGQAPGTQYSTGQQSLDQLLLSQSGGLGQTQSTLQEQAKQARQLSREAGLTGKDVESLVGQERDLMSKLNEQARLNEEAYLNMLGSYVPTVQQQREQEYQSLEDALRAYQTPAEGMVSTQPVQSGLTAEQLQRLGINREYGAFDVLENLQRGAGGTLAEQVASKGREAKTYKDVAEQSDVDRYAALARIAGIEPSRLTEASNLGDAYTAATDVAGKNVLVDMLEKAEDIFNQRAKETVVDDLGRVRDDYGAENIIRNINRARELDPNYVGVTDAIASDLVERGRGGLYSSPTDTRRTDLSDKTYDTFLKWLEEQKYRRTIGGDTGGSLYGRRQTPGENK